MKTKFKVTVEQIDITEYPELENEYHYKGKAYSSRYILPEGIDPDSESVQVIAVKTGKILLREDRQDIYEQTVDDSICLKAIITAVNG